MNTKNLSNWENLESNNSNDTIETLMLEESKKIFEQNPKVGVPTKHFKDNFNRIFKRNSTNPQPRLNKAMNSLANSNQVEIKKVSNKNYIRYIPIPKQPEKSTK